MRGKTVVAGLLAAGLVLGAGAWWLRGGGEDAVTSDKIGDQIQTVRRGRLPVFAAQPEVAELYRFAATEGGWLAGMPCTCGCAELGHASNRACYIKEETADRVTFTSHAAT